MPAPPDSDPSASTDPVHLDSLLVVDFTVGGTGALYQTTGWSPPEARLSWAVGGRSGLRLPAPWSDRPHVLELDVNPCCLPPHVTGQTLTMHVNGRFLGSHVLTERRVLRCPLPPEVWRGRNVIEVAFDHPNFLVPRLIGPSADTRPLAISFYSVRLYSEHAPRPTVRLPVRPPPMAEPLWLAEQPEPTPPRSAPQATAPVAWAFGDGRPGAKLTGEGWAAPQPDGQWTEKAFARLNMPALPAPGSYLLRLTCAAPTEAAQDLAVSCNGRVLAHLSAGRRRTLGVPLPVEESVWPEPYVLGLHVHGADQGDAVCLHEVAVEPLRPELIGWAGLRADGAAPPATALPLADRFCAVPEAELPSAVQTHLATTPAALLPEFVRLDDEGVPAGGAAEAASVLRRTFVIARPGGRAVPAELLPLLQSLNKDGPATLICVVPGARPERNGAVELLGPGLMRGHVVALGQGGGIGAGDWLRLAANATLLRAVGRGAAPKPGPAPPPKAAEPPRPQPVASAPPPQPAPPPPPRAAEPPRPQPAPPPKVAAAEPPKPPPVASPPPPRQAAPADAAQPNLATMLREFESLGDNSEFGFVQRKAGVEVLGLFRFADITLKGLVEGLADNFTGIGEPDAVSISVSNGSRPEYILSVDRYGMRWPTQMYADEAEAATTLQRQSMKLGYLRRKFLESLRAGGRTYVLRRNESLTEADAAPVAEALARHGRNTLLYVQPGAAAEESGEVRRVAPGLLCGRLERLAPADDPASADIAGWVRMITNAWWEQGS